MSWVVQFFLKVFEYLLRHFNLSTFKMLGMAAVISGTGGQFPDSGRNIFPVPLYHSHVWLCLVPTLTVLILLVIFKNFLGFYFSFSQFQTIICSSYSLELLIKKLLDFVFVVTHKYCWVSIQYCRFTI